MFWWFLKKNYLAVNLNTLHTTQQWSIGLKGSRGFSIMEIDPCILIRCNMFALSSTFSNLELWTAFI